jgi:sigma-B regulation protein RsbU (phosphoserine phosphatase)
VPCRTIGGDFFDYLELADGRLVCALGDVAGKGPPAALLATAVQSLFAAHASTALDPSDALARINEGLMRRTIQTRFATMFYGVLSNSGALRYCCAGHEPPLLVARSGIRSLEAGGLVLGLFGHASYEPETVQLEPGDLLVVCSDGVTEARSPADEEFGRERLVESIRGGHGMEVGVLVKLVMQAVRDFVGGAPQADDVTLLVLRYRGRSNAG